MQFNQQKNPEQKRVSPAFWKIIIFLGLLYLAYHYINNGNKPTAQSETKQSNNTKNELTLGQKLSLIESGDAKSINDPYIITTDSLLKILSEKYNEPKDTIADYTQRGIGVLKEENIEENSAGLMKGINILPKMDNTKYKDVVTLFVMTMSKSNEQKTQ